MTNLLHRAPLFFLIFAGCLFADGQSLAGLKIGDNQSQLESFGEPVATDTYKSYVIRKWSLPDGNELSVTTEPSGKIVYLEIDSGGRSEATGCNLQGLAFGRTTLSALRKRFGSNGFAFRNRGGVAELPDGIVMINAFDVGQNVVTFFTKIEADGESTAPVADRAKLDAISIADPKYAQSEWGERVYDPKYKKVMWK